MNKLSINASQVIPAVLDDLTPLYLTNVLQASGLLNAVTVKRIQIVDRYAGMTSQVGRFQLEYDREESSAPRTAIIKLPSPDVKTRQYFSGWGYYKREVRFYSILDGKMTFRMPRCFAAAYDPASGMSLLVLEDLDGLDNQVTIESCTAQRAEILIRMLAKFHAAWWNRPALEDFDWLYRPDHSIDQTMVATALQNWENLCQVVGDRIAPVMDAIDSRVAAFPHAKAARLNRPPFTMIHGDFQFPNLFFDPIRVEAEPVVTDFQFVSRNNGPSNDLAFFISTCLEQQVRKACEKRLLSAYHSTLIQQGVTDYPRSMFMDDCRFGLFNCMMRLSTLVAGGYIKDSHALLARFHRLCTIIEDNQAWKAL